LHWADTVVDKSAHGVAVTGMVLRSFLDARCSGPFQEFRSTYVEALQVTTASLNHSVNRHGNNIRHICPERIEHQRILATVIPSAAASLAQHHLNVPILAPSSVTAAVTCRDFMLCGICPVQLTLALPHQQSHWSFVRSDELPFMLIGSASVLRLFAILVRRVGIEHRALSAPSWLETLLQHSSYKAN